MAKVFTLVDRKTQLSAEELEIANRHYVMLGQQLDTLGAFFKDDDKKFNETRRYYGVCGSLLRTGRALLNESALISKIGEIGFNELKKEMKEIATPYLDKKNTNNN